MGRRKLAIELTHARIRTTALALIDRGGLEAFSTRQLGEALGCEAMAIYYYYPTKDAILDGVVDELLADLTAAVDDEGDDWVATLRAVAQAYRGIALAHPKAFVLLATRRFGSDAAFAFLDKLFALARTNGVADRTTATFYRVVSSYCSGFALNELATPRASAKLRKYPTAAAVSRYLATEELDAMFARGLEIQLAALVTACA